MWREGHGTPYCVRGVRIRNNPALFLWLDPPPIQRRDTVAEYLEADLVEFEQLQYVVNTYLHDNPASKANVMYHSAAIYSPEQESPLYDF